MEPASIRYKNPGAMWGSALAIKWGAQKNAVTLNDGKGQGNNIAVFPTYVQGICAQLDLWRSSPRYKNKPFADAIAVWSGHNEVESYIKFVLSRVPGMKRDTIMNDAFWSSSKGIAFLKAQAWHEAGKPYPAPDADWIEAQRRVFDAVTPEKQPTKPKRPTFPPPPDIEPTPPKEEETKPAIKSKSIWGKAIEWLTGNGLMFFSGIDWKIWVAFLVLSSIVTIYIIHKRIKREDIVGWFS